jgi:hypothetical protein
MRAQRQHHEAACVVRTLHEFDRYTRPEARCNADREQQRAGHDPHEEPVHDNDASRRIAEIARSNLSATACLDALWRFQLVFSGIMFQ